LRLSSRPQHHMHIDQTAQYELPFLAKTEKSARVGATDPESELRTEHPVGKTQGPQDSNTPEIHESRRRKRQGKPSDKAKTPPEAKLLVSREEGAAMLSISVRGVDYLISTKRLSTRRIGTRVLIPIEDVRKFARADHPQRLAG